MDIQVTTDFNSNIEIENFNRFLEEDPELCNLLDKVIKYLKLIINYYK